MASFFHASLIVAPGRVLLCNDMVRLDSKQHRTATQITYYNRTSGRDAQTGPNISLETYIPDEEYLPGKQVFRQVYDRHDDLHMKIMCGNIVKHARLMQLTLSGPDSDTTGLIFHPNVDNGNHPTMAGWITRDCHKWSRFINNMVIEGAYT